MKLSLDHIDALVFDFDGVLTDNTVYIDQNGNESVNCSRSDGLAFNALLKLNKPTYILSSEKNPIVAARAEKLKIPVIQGVENKRDALLTLANEKGFNLDHILYVGNDLNDYLAMQSCGFNACPADSHPDIKKISSIVLSTLGGKGVVRELVEEVFSLNILKVLYEE